MAQMTGCGGVVSFDVKGGLPASKRFLDALKLCYIAPSLGGVETLITHPAIVAALRRQIDQALRCEDTVAVVVDAPLLLEADLDGLCDVLVLVDCPREGRLARAEARGWDAAELDRREGHQRPIELKRERADIIIDGNTSLETTFRQVQQLWRRTLGL